jgi:cellulose synthase/poly-beta-1,6-N-acetylglucosamine synthase-like glycosyltransferase
LLLILKTRKKYSINEKIEDISVIIVFRNEEKNLPALFESLIKQSYPIEKIQYILVDDRSEDLSNQLAEAFKAKVKNCTLLKIEKLPKGKFGKKNGLENAINIAKNDILIFTDADCIADANWLETSVKYFKDDVKCVLGKSQLIPKGLKAVTLFQEAESYYNHIIAERSASYNYPVMSFGRNFAYRKSAFDEIGAFKNVEQSMSGDDDLILAEFTKKGFRTAFNAESQVLSKTVSSWHEFRVQKVRHMSVTRFLPKIYQTIAILFHGTHFALILSIAFVSSMNEAFVIILSKLAIDLIVFLRMNKILKYSQILRVYTMWSLAYWIYIPLISIFSYTKQVNKINWK